MAIGKISGQPEGFDRYSIGILRESSTTTEDKEFQALVEFLETLKFSNLYILTTNDLARQSKLLREIDLIWFYKKDTLPLKSTISKKLSGILAEYVKKGGKLILANQACIMIPMLLPGENAPETRVKQSTDNGYGRMLGFHAFRQHPLFEGMNGGAYVLKPLNDTLVMQTGYFSTNKPVFGNVIGIDWDYIFLREESKLIIEFETGKGKILAIGGYLLYSMPNRNRIHLETFTKNIFRYLSENEHNLKSFYWNYDSSGVSEKPFKLSLPLPRPKTTIFPVADSSFCINPGKSTGNYWDLAGERQLLMGDDNGGIREIWAHPAMCLRDYNVAYRLPVQQDTMKDLGSLKPDIEILPSAYVRKYNLTGDLLNESITVSPHQPFSIIHYDYQGKDPAIFDISFRLLFRLMWPYSEKVLGNLYYSWNDELQAFIASDQSGDFVTIIGINGKKDDISWSRSDPGNFGMPSQILSLHVNLSGVDSFDVIIASSAEGFHNTLQAYLEALADPGAVFTAAQSYADSILNQSLEVNTPDQDFNDGYRWALLATDRFQVHTPGIGSSLVAGYATSDKGWDGQHAVNGRPGYGWYFGRDGAWSGFALLHYGDFRKVRLMLETFQRFQDLNGKIFHELTTSGVVHYDAADATPLYLILAGRYLRHSGDSAFIRESWPFIKEALDFCYSTDTDGDLLIENTNVGHGWVEGGHLFGSHTSLYLASCWAAALDEAAYMAKNLGHDAEKQRYSADALTVKTTINKNFWNPQENYYYQGLMADGSYKDDIAIMPCIPLLFNQSDRDKTQKILPVIAANGFTSDWGSRIVQEGSPDFNPGGYHTGSVWPLFTGWASLAEFRNNNYLQGYSSVMSNILIYKYWGLGFIEEVLNGETYEPFGVCHHQCWSETMALQPVIEGMLGYQPDALNHRIELRPWFPADWDSVKVSGIRVGDARISLIVQSSKFKVQSGKGGTPEAAFIDRYSFSKDTTGRLDVHFQPVFPPGAVINRVTVNGLPAKDPGVRETEQGWVIPDFGFWLDSAEVVEISWQGGITALPIVSNPKPGDRSEGLRIINTSYLKGKYSIAVEGLAGKQYEFRVWAANPENYKVDGAKITAISGNIISLTLDLLDPGTKYANSKVVLSF